MLKVQNLLPRDGYQDDAKLIHWKFLNFGSHWSTNFNPAAKESDPLNT
jgi:hypothetical protein